MLKAGAQRDHSRLERQGGFLFPAGYVGGLGVVVGQAGFPEVRVGLAEALDEGRVRYGDVDGVDILCDMESLGAHQLHQRVQTGQRQRIGHIGHRLDLGDAACGDGVGVARYLLDDGLGQLLDLLHSFTGHIHCKKSSL